MFFLLQHGNIVYIENYSSILYHNNFIYIRNPPSLKASIKAKYSDSKVIKIATQTSKRRTCKAEANSKLPISIPHTKHLVQKKP